MPSMPEWPWQMQIDPLRVSDLLSADNINLDAYTANFSVWFYIKYIADCPELCLACRDRELAGYLIACMKQSGLGLHGHLAALSVAPSFRGTGAAQTLMLQYEKVLQEKHHCSCATLYVRVSNTHAISFYKKLGYTVQQTLTGYYTGEAEEDGYEMIKTLGKERLSAAACLEDN